MAMNIYSDVPANGPISYAIHLDTTKVDDQGQPDPAWVEWYTFPAADLTQKPAGQNNAQYKAAYADQCKTEARALARLARQTRNKAIRKAADLGTPEADNS